MTIKDLGILGNDNAPVEEIMTFSSYSNPGKGVGSDPVAMIVFLAVISLTPPLSSVT